MDNTIEFKIEKTEIPGLLIIKMDSHEDDRGYFTEKFQKQKLVALGFPEGFVPVQQNLSFNKQTGTTRGFHAEPWDKYITVIAGKVYSVLVDLRQENFGKAVGITIDANTAVFLPKGVANSFQTLKPDTYYSYLVNDFWSPTNQEKYKFVNLNDPDLAVAWPIALAEAVISDKDKNHPPLSQVTPFTL
jgi:dTDP-4-dehydrorhamnose 3,5-epimerase